MPRLTLRRGMTLLAFLPCLALAAPDDDVNSPDVDADGHELLLKYGHFREPNASSHTRGLTLAYGLTVSEGWFSSLQAAFDKTPQSSNRYAGVVSENTFSLAKDGALPFDLGALVAITVPRNRGEGVAFTIGPLLEFKGEGWKVNLNGFVTKVAGGSDLPAEERRAYFSYQAQFLKAFGEDLDVGLQSFGDVGPVSGWLAPRDQSHRIGPTVQGKVKLGEDSAIEYDVAYLFGTTRGTPDRGIRLLFAFTW